MEDRPHQTAVAVVRAWVDGGAPATLKVRVLTSPGLGEPLRTLGLATDPNGACAILSAWLEDLLDDAGDAEGDDA